MLLCYSILAKIVQALSVCDVTSCPAAACCCKSAGSPRNEDFNSGRLKSRCQSFFTLTLSRPGFFDRLGPAAGGGGGGGGWGSPEVFRCNFETACAMVTKFTQNNVVMNFSNYRYFSVIMSNVTSL